MRERERVRERKGSEGEREGERVREREGGREGREGSEVREGRRNTQEVNSRKGRQQGE